MTAQDAPRGSRLVLITRAEFNAIAEAAALHQAEYEGETDPQVRRRADRVDAALTDVIQKWHAAGDRPPAVHAEQGLDDALAQIEQAGRAIAAAREAHARYFGGSQ